MPIDLEAASKRYEAVRQALTDATIVVRYARCGQPIPVEVLAKPLEQVEDECDMAHLWVAQKLPALLAELTTTRAMFDHAHREVGRLREACRKARLALDTLMGDTDLDDDESLEMQAMHALGAALEGEQP